jgi:hypothetical protein
MVTSSVRLVYQGPPPPLRGKGYGFWFDLKPVLGIT